MAIERCSMAQLVTIAMAALRFVAALAVGYILLFILNVTLLSAGFERFSGIIFVSGLILTLATAIHIAGLGHLNTNDRAAATAATSSLRAEFVAIALVALRFVAVLAVGFVLLFVANALLLFAGVERFQGVILLAGLILTVSAAMRIAVRGRLNTFDRAAGTAAAGVFALIFAGLALAVLGGLALLAVVWFLAHFAGPGPAAFAAINALFERGTAFIVLMQIGIGASLAATWLLWRRHNGHTGPQI
jgi:hypothetical protein